MGAAMYMIPLVTVLLGAYLLGSINFSILVMSALGKGDPRRHGSGNPGATNVHRQAGIVWAVAVLCLDLGRSFAVGYAALTYLPPAWITWAGLTLVLGNRFPCFHRFSGGKGVANFLGFTLVLHPPTALMAGIAWLVGRVVGRASFIGSHLMLLVLVGGTYWNYGDAGILAVAGTLITAALIVNAHQENWRAWRSSHM